jgi:CSLREA domain-containing protein
MLRSSAVVVSEVIGLRGKPRVLALFLVAVVGLLVLAVGARPAQAAPSTFTVNSTADTDDGLCSPRNPFRPSLECTLREAINAANSNGNAAETDLIKFSIPGNGPHSIKPSGLPEITQPVTIDGYTEGDATSTADDDATENTLTKGTNAKLLIELDGTNFAATRGLGISTSDTTVRGLVINRFAVGITVSGSANKVEGNFLGTDITGTQDSSGTFEGVRVSAGSNNTVGGTVPEARNLISGNGDFGVTVSQNATDTVIAGNLIGTDKTGTANLGNSSSGVGIFGADNTTIGGNTASAANIIAFSEGDGVSVQNSQDSFGNVIAAENNKVQRNSIFSNGGLGIDLIGLGENIRTTDVPTANDGGTADDSDTGPNGLQNKPNLSSAVTSGGTTTIGGVLDTKLDTTYTVQFFSQGGGDEGKKFIGRKQVPTDDDGRVTFSFSPANAVAVGQKITATATGPEGTSEYSAPKTVVAS